MDCSLPDSSVHGIFQARVLKWVAIVFSDQGPETVLNILDRGSDVSVTVTLPHKPCWQHLNVMMWHLRLEGLGSFAGARGW